MNYELKLGSREAYKLGSLEVWKFGILKKNYWKLIKALDQREHLQLLGGRMRGGWKRIIWE